MNVLKLLMATTAIMIGVLLLMVISDLILPAKPVIVDPDPCFIIYPETQDDWAETANALDVHPTKMTFKQYNEHIMLDSVGDVFNHMKERR